MRPAEVDFQLCELQKLMRRDAVDFRKDELEYSEHGWDKDVFKFSTGASALEQCLIIIDAARKQIHAKI